jgi:hypothetical protein
MYLFPISIMDATQTRTVYNLRYENSRAYNNFQGHTRQGSSNQQNPARDTKKKAYTR